MIEEYDIPRGIDPDKYQSNTYLVPTIDGKSSREMFVAEGGVVTGLASTALREGVIVLKDGEFKGDPTKVLGHPSNPATKPLQAYNDSFKGDA